MLLSVFSQWVSLLGTTFHLISTIMMLALTIAKVYKTCKFGLIQDSKHSGTFNISRKQSSSCENSSNTLESSDIFNINRRLASDNYFQKRKRCRHIYFTFIPKVKTRLRISEWIMHWNDKSIRLVFGFRSNKLHTHTHWCSYVVIIKSIYNLYQSQIHDIQYSGR